MVKTDLFTKDKHIILPGRISSIDSLKKRCPMEQYHFKKKVREGTEKYL